MADWFYGIDNAQHGPVSDLEIRNLISTGTITEETIIWREGMADWIPMKDVPEFQMSSVATQSNQGETGTHTPYATPQSHPGNLTVIPTDGLSIASIVLGVSAVLASCMYIGIIFGIPAVICGHMSLKKINQSAVPIQGKGLAIAGLVTGYLGSLCSLLLIGFVALAIGSAAL